MNANRCRRPFLLLLVLAASAANGQDAAPIAGESQGPEIYFIPFSHLDLYWGGTREECLARGNGIIAQAVRLAARSPKFRFLLEDEVFVSNCVDTHQGSRELEDLKRLVKEGRIELAPKWAAIFQGLPDGEVHARNLAIGKRYAHDVFVVDAQVAHLGDLPASPRAYHWSSARAHLRGRDDGLVKVAPLLAMAEDWRGLLRSAVCEEELRRFRQGERTGRPLGDDEFLARLEAQLGRVLRRQKPGPKKKQKRGRKRKLARN
jgi:hypothetical protein